MSQDRDYYNIVVELWQGILLSIQMCSTQTIRSRPTPQAGGPSFYLKARPARKDISANFPVRRFTPNKLDTILQRTNYHTRGGPSRQFKEGLSYVAR
jgi:hypothetical protein